jgi:hypothetical protein
MKIILMQAALSYAVVGYAVFPCKPRDKKPLTKNGVKDATTDAATICRWWQQYPNANIGLATDKLLVIDVDSPEGQNWLDKQGALPITPIQRTSKGKHIFFAMQEGQELRNTAGRIAGIDTRGKGGYIMVAPSIHPSGKHYEWERSLLDYPPQPAPEWLIAALYPPPKPPQPYALCKLRDDSNGSRYGLKALENQCNIIAHAPAGTQNPTLNKCAFIIGRLVGGGEINPRYAFAQVVRAGLCMSPSKEPWRQEQVIKIVDKALREGAAQPCNAPSKNHRFTHSKRV